MAFGSPAIAEPEARGHARWKAIAPLRCFLHQWASLRPFGFGATGIKPSRSDSE
jgi:hypothetical protein